MRLAAYIQQNRQAIACEWMAFNRKFQIPASLPPAELEGHIHTILDFIIADVQTNQTEFQRAQKSQNTIDDPLHAAQNLAAWRLSKGYTLQQMIAEYRALRASITQLWVGQLTTHTHYDLSDLIRFDESIDQLLGASVNHYTLKLEEARAILIGILGHDLRAPISALHMSAQVIERVGALNEKQKQLTQQMIASALRANEITANLLDLTLARLGAGLSVNPQKMDMAVTAKRLVDELNAAHPDRNILLQCRGDTDGVWDALRIGQVLSNLLGNALQYGLLTAPIEVLIEGFEHAVTLSVHNQGIPIPPALTSRIFSSFTRGSDMASGGKNLGLGLYITKEIVAAHQGSIELSSGNTGTTFTVKLPRHSYHAN